MKDYKRLTERRGGLVIDNCGNCPNVNNKQGCNDKKCHEIKKNRLADLEDKINSGEICDCEEARKETAEEIFNYLFSLLVNANFATGNAEISFIKFRAKAKEYGIELFGNSDKLRGNNEQV